jgi:excisionase family DNA binding protein
MTIRKIDPKTLSQDEQRELKDQLRQLLEILDESVGVQKSTFPRTSDSSSTEEVMPEYSRLLDEVDLQFDDLLEEQGDKPCLAMNIGAENLGLRLPRHFTSVMIEVLLEIAQGRSVSIGTEEEELTTGEAAELLNVSRPHLVKLLEEGEIPFHKVGTHRRVYREDVLEYKSRQREEAEEAMQNLTDQAQELGLGY